MMLVTVVVAFLRALATARAIDALYRNSAAWKLCRVLDCSLYEEWVAVFSGIRSHPWLVHEKYRNSRKIKDISVSSVNKTVGNYGNDLGFLYIRTDTTPYLNDI